MSGFKVGEKIKVQFKGYDALGRIRLSRKSLLPLPTLAESALSAESGVSQPEGTVPGQQNSTDRNDTTAKVSILVWNMSLLCVP